MFIKLTPAVESSKAIRIRADNIDHYHDQLDHENKLFTIVASCEAEFAVKETPEEIDRLIELACVGVALQ